MATLDNLADALPSADEDEDNTAVGNRTVGNKAAEQVNVIKRKSLKSKPGALKRRLKVDNEEAERFRRNMGQMSAKSGDQEGGMGMEVQGGQNGLGRWKALRGFIEQTMEKRDMSVLNAKT